MLSFRWQRYKYNLIKILFLKKIFYSALFFTFFFTNYIPHTTKWAILIVYLCLKSFFCLSSTFFGLFCFVIQK